MEQGLYPLKFLPLMKSKIWGGTKIKDNLGIDFSPLDNCGELWALSAVEGEETLIENGFLAQATLKEVIQMYSDELLGEENFAKFYDNFPLLLKIIDAADNLSVQVHPDDRYAQSVGVPNGKSEMWYVINSDKGSIITSGFRKRVTKSEILNSIRSNNLADILNTEPTFEDDVFYIPAGTIHAIGKGVLLAEIQQNCDLTYRLYDYDRTDEQGNKRQLHLKDAIEVLDLSPVYDTAKHHYHNHLNHTHNIIETPYFSTNIVNLNMESGLRKDYSFLDSFVIYFCVGGSADVQSLNTTLHIQAGEAMLLPAITKEAIIIPHNAVKILE
ncbi:MAG: class I mannose-6-phosphate isomerase, partial [Bacteroidales bacterium]|nr:class I mannose-6-phosphate isomerase [Bacteroidales bacterium]